MLKIAEVFGDNMVLQRGKTVSIWGEAAPGSRVSVSVQGKAADAVADASGKWMAALENLQTSHCEEVVITDGADTVRFANVAVGEVWLAGGQSNMEFYMHYDKDFDEVKPNCQNADIRFFDYPEASCERAWKERDFSEYGFWRTCDSENLDYFSAVGYYFAKYLQEALDVPVGILGCNCGGTRACCWMDEETIAEYGPSWLEDYENGLSRIVDFQKMEDEYFSNQMTNPTHPFDNPMKEKMMKGMTLQELQDMMAAFVGTDFAEVYGPWHEWRPAGLYHTMLENVMPYTVRGVIYYQGESDETHTDIYADMLEGLIGLWRTKWNDQIPFIMAHLAPFGVLIGDGGKMYPALREQQDLAAERMADVYVTSIGDVGNEIDIHPKEKQPVGRRMALLARGHVYGEDILCEAPIPDGVTVEGKQITIHFANAKGGLTLKGDTVNALEVRSKAEHYGEAEACDDSKCGAAGCAIAVSAEAAVDGENLILTVSDDPAERELEIRFAKTPFYEVNLYNAADIPVKPFALTI